MTRQKRVPPLVLEWEPDSDDVGDFAWGGFGAEVVIRRAIADELGKHFSGFVAEPIEMIERDESNDRGVRVKPKVQLPYNGPELCELWIDSWGSLDEQASQVVHERTCGTCGFRFYKPKRSGLILANESFLPDFFRLQQFPSWMFCTGSVREFVLKKGWLNITFLDVGVSQKGAGGRGQPAHCVISEN